ncbi:GNAT family N-acetyltransferase [Methylorubrum salsuginis]|uniref:Protein N-acetyltransferase, RimJ/RimL family n=1 Tax=Methylorubrum salsuginis TaxID=414703 RepID=A0A1I4HW79_9HYPH|nr:GNAT family N-acetyltransferase [Methylorubrum salsuginis]SFL46398.1 Protein N-acetyltransferase, RimJ/RimL family [Methylorubrum salsuginis]
MFPDLTRDDVFRIETRRLWLRWPTARDAEAVARLAGDPAVARMTAQLPSPMPLHEAEGFVLRVRAGNTEGKGLIMVVCRRASPGQPVGIIGIGPRPEAPAPHLGYWLGRPYWGEGLMSEAAAAIVEAYFAYAGGRELVSSAMVDNPASRRVLEKSGFVADSCGEIFSVARGETVAADSFRLDRAGWLDRRGRVS